MNRATKLIEAQGVTVADIQLTACTSSPAHRRLPSSRGFSQQFPEIRLAPGYRLIIDVDADGHLLVDQCASAPYDAEVTRLKTELARLKGVIASQKAHTRAVVDERAELKRMNDNQARTIQSYSKSEEKLHAMIREMRDEHDRLIIKHDDTCTQSEATIREQDDARLVFGKPLGSYTTAHLRRLTRQGVYTPTRRAIERVIARREVIERAFAGPEADGERDAPTPEQDDAHMVSGQALGSRTTEGLEGLRCVVSPANRAVVDRILARRKAHEVREDYRGIYGNPWKCVMETDFPKMEKRAMAHEVADTAPDALTKLLTSPSPWHRVLGKGEIMEDIAAGRAARRENRLQKQFKRARKAARRRFVEQEIG